MKYPKLITGTFLSRVSFAEMYHDLPSSVKTTIKQNDLLQRVARRTRGESYSAREALYGGGYYDSCRRPLRGPTVFQWIEGFTREQDPVDLLSQLDIDDSMGKMKMDNAECGEQGCIKHWILENRGMGRFGRAQLPEVWDLLFLFLSEFNLRQIPTPNAQQDYTLELPESSPSPTL
jgi:hypothetical protein